METKPRLPLDYATGVGSTERPRPRSGTRWLWLIGLLAAGIVAVILFRGRGAQSGTAAIAERTPAPVPTGEAAVLSPMTSPAPTEAPAVQPTAAPARVAATTIVAPPRATAASAASAASAAPRVPTATAVPPRATPRPAATSGPTRETSTPPPAAAAPATAPEPPGSSRQAWLDRAARDRQKANADRRNHFTIQLELACETQTLVDASKYDRPAGTLWVLTTPYEGRTCFRVLWGRYPSKEAARRALANVPPFFATAHNRPVVTAIR
jgi:septal ring-binding cell division protein DamX